MTRALSRAEFKDLSAQLHEGNKAHGPALRMVPEYLWPKTPVTAANLALGMIEVWRSCDFLVQVFEERDGAVRLSVNRTRLDRETGRWRDGITWDELQRIKREVGRGDQYAVELFPDDADVVDVANVRHLWVLPEPPPYAWRRACGADAGGVQSSATEGRP